MKEKLGWHSHLKIQSITYRILQNDWAFHFVLLFLFCCLLQGAIKMFRELYFFLQSCGQASESRTS